MRFLISTASREALPIQMAGTLLEATQSWGKKYQASKKIEQLWVYAGLPAGGGIFNVASVEEMNQIMAEYPLSQFSRTEIYPLVDWDKGMVDAVTAYRKMAPPQ
jgi:muconolactone delta-isomerase